MSSALANDHALEAMLALGWVSAGAGAEEPEVLVAQRTFTMAEVRLVEDAKDALKKKQREELTKTVSSPSYDLLLGCPLRHSLLLLRSQGPTSTVIADHFLHSSLAFAVRGLATLNPASVLKQADFSVQYEEKRRRAKEMVAFAITLCTTHSLIAGVVFAEHG